MGKIYSIQILRALAALCIVSLHSFHIASRGGDSHGYLYHLHAGVDLFFVISGFVMVYISKNDNSLFDSFVFILKRLARIFPIWWIVVLAKGGGLYFFPNLFNTQKFDFISTIKSLFLIPHYNADGLIYPIVGVGWTLQYEMFFYFIFSLSLSFIYGRTLIFFLFSILVLLGFSFGFSSPFLKMATNPIIIEFLFGIIIAMMYIGRREFLEKFHKFFVIIGLVSFLFVIYFDIHFHRTIIWGVPCALIFAGFLPIADFKFTKLTTLFVLLGDSSYSIYITHTLMIPVISKILYISHFNNLHAVTIFMTSFLFCVTTGYVFFLLVERPMNQYFSGVIRNIFVTKSC